MKWLQVEQTKMAGGTLTVYWILRNGFFCDSEITGKEYWNRRDFVANPKLSHPIPLPGVKGAIDTMAILVLNQAKLSVLAILETRVLQHIDSTGVQIPVVKQDSLISIQFFRKLSCLDSFGGIFPNNLIS